jgi:DNA-binding transcriptional LysR family regulator
VAALEALPWIGFAEGMSSVLQARWMQERLPDMTPRLRMDSFVAILQSAARGVGVAAIPIFTAAQEPRLVRISQPLDMPPIFQYRCSKRVWIDPCPAWTAVCARAVLHAPSNRHFQWPACGRFHTCGPACVRSWRSFLYVFCRV